MEFKEAVPYVVAAYMGIWVLLLAYVMVVFNRLNGMRKQVEALSKAVKREREPSGQKEKVEV